MAGKTGTAQKVVGRSFSKSKYNSLFIGVIPADKPVLAIVVVVDEPKGAIYGGVVAAPIFREIAAQSMRFLGYYPQLQLPTPTDTILVKSPRTSKHEPPPPAAPASVIQASLVCTPRDPGPLKQMPDFKGMPIRKVINILNQSGIRCQIEGCGLAVEQRPAPGAPLPNSNLCYVKFKPR